MSRPLVWSSYGLLVFVWSSTWVAIKFGLEGTPPLLGAGLRFASAGLLLLGVAVLQRRSLRTDAGLAAVLALVPFALSYGLIYWAEQYVPSGLTAVLFGVMPIYVAVLAAFLLSDEPVHGRLFAGLGMALAGLVVAFAESLELGHHERAGLGAAAVLLSSLCAAIGNVAIRRRGAGADAVVLNGWGMLAGGAFLLVASAPTEAWGTAVWDTTAIGAIAYLAVLGSAVPFVLLTLLLHEIGAIAMSYLPLVLPFGALVLGWWLYSEELTVASLAGAAMVAAGLLIAQARRRVPVSPREPRPGPA